MTPQNRTYNHLTCSSWMKTFLPESWRSIVAHVSMATVSPFSIHGIGESNPVKHLTINNRQRPLCRWYCVKWLTDGHQYLCDCTVSRLHLVSPAILRKNQSLNSEWKMKHAACRCWFIHLTDGFSQRVSRAHVETPADRPEHPRAKC